MRQLLAAAALVLLAQYPISADDQAERGLAIVESAFRSSDCGRPFSYRAVVTVRPKDSVPWTTRLHWTVARDPVEGDVACRWSLSSGVESYAVRQGDRQFVVSKGPKGPWASHTTTKAGFTFDGRDPIQWYFHPVVPDETLAEMLRRRPPIKVVLAPDVIEMIIPAAPQVAESLKSGPSFFGCIGWAFRFERRDGLWVLSRVDRLETLQVPGPKGDKAPWIGNPAIVHQLTDREPFVGVQTGVAIRAEFSDFTRIGSQFLPGRVLQTDSMGSTESVVTKGSMELLDELPPGALAMRPPVDFGSKGVHRDEFSGEEYSSSAAGRDPRDLVEDMVARGESKGAGVPTGSGFRWRGVLIGSGIALLGAVLVLSVRASVRRRRESRSTS